jgi:hypothetical protein
VCELKEFVPCQQRNPFVELSMDGGLSPSEVVVIERGQVVVHQGEQVHQFNGTGKDGSGFGCQTKLDSRFVSQSRPQAFPRAFERIEDGISET